MTIAQDHLGLTIDAKPKNEREVKITSYEGLSDQILMLRRDPKSFKETISYHRNPSPEGVYYTGVKTDTGYAVEAALPHSVGDTYYGKKWESLRFNLIIFDVDQLTGSSVSLLWRPSWPDHRSYKNSGPFLRNRSEDEPSDDRK